MRSRPSVVLIGRSPLGRGLPPPPGGGRSASVARREPGGGESHSPHPARFARDPPPPGEGEECAAPYVQLIPWRAPTSHHCLSGCAKSSRKYLNTHNSGLGAACPSPQIEASRIACDNSVSSASSHGPLRMS